MNLKQRVEALEKVGKDHHEVIVVRDGKADVAIKRPGPGCDVRIEVVREKLKELN